MAMVILPLGKTLAFLQTLHISILLHCVSSVKYLHTVRHIVWKSRSTLKRRTSWIGTISQVNQKFPNSAHRQSRRSEHFFSPFFLAQKWRKATCHTAESSYSSTELNSIGSISRLFRMKLVGLICPGLDMFKLQSWVSCLQARGRRDEGVGVNTQQHCTHGMEAQHDMREVPATIGLHKLSQEVVFLAILASYTRCPRPHLLALLPNPT